MMMGDDRRWRSQMWGKPLSDPVAAFTCCVGLAAFALWVVYSGLWMPWR